VFINYNCDGARLWDRRGNEYAIRSWEREKKGVTGRRKRETSEVKLQHTAISTCCEAVFPAKK
jgi:hypothetical protein